MDLFGRKTAKELNRRIAQYQRDLDSWAEAWLCASKRALPMGVVIPSARGRQRKTWR